MSYIKEELKRAFFSKTTAISFLLTFICIFIGSAEYIFKNYPGTNAIYLFMYAYSQGTSAVLSFAFPMLVSLPYAASLVEDFNSGFNHYIFIKMKSVRYLVIRLLVNALAGGLVLFLSLLISFFLFAVTKNFDLSSTDLLNINLYNSIYQESPVIYIFILIANSFVCGVVFSTLGLGLSTIFKNQYLAVLSPFVFYIFSGTILVQINKYFNAAILFDINYYKDLKLVNILSYDVVLLLTGVIIFFIGALRYEEW